MYYEETNKIADKKTKKMITDLLNQNKDELFQEEIEYISKFSFSYSFFYGLPKIYKSAEILLKCDTATKL